MEKLNRTELSKQFNLHEDIVRAVCLYFNEDEQKVKDCLSDKKSYLRVCRLQNWKKQLSAEDFEYIQKLSGAEAKQFLRKKTLEKKHGSLENFYKEQDQKRKTTLQSRYGRQTSFDPEKSKQTKLERYGDENYNNSTQASKTKKSFSEKQKADIQEKKKCTLEEKYGSKNFKDIEKWRKTIERRFGSFENYMNLIMQKSKQTKLERYGDENYTNKEKAAETKRNWTESFRKALREKTAETNRKRFGVSCPFLLQKNHPWHISKPERQLRDFLKSLSVEFVTNNKNLIKVNVEHPLELDIYIPAKKVAIEYNGLYWHSETHKPNNYHQLKSNLCRQQGIRLIHIFGDDWIQKRGICESIIKSALGIYDQRIFARKCELRDLNQKDYGDFLNTNHIQGSVNSSIRKGLFYNGELVQVIGIGKSRFKKNEYELHRMCTKLNTQVVGGFSKLIKSVKDIDSLVTYVDLSLFDGKGYERIGFEYLYQNRPNYWYLDKSCCKRLSRQTCQKHKLKNLLGESFDPNLTEVQNMHKAGYVRLFDSGNLKLVYHY